MNTIQQNPIQSSHIKEPEVPNLFYFILGVILVFGSGVTADGEDLSSNNSVPTEIMVDENRENFALKLNHISKINLEDAKLLVKR